MKIERTKNATRNIIFGVSLKIYQIAMPFLIRTLFIYIMGVEYLGLNSLFTSILSVLSLAELGVGSAMVYSMYKPLAEDDTETVCALMRLYKIYYRAIGFVILAAGLAVLPFLPNLIKSDLPADVNLYVLYLLNLASTVLSYWLFAYKNCIISANQRVDVNSKVSLAMTTVTYAGQIMVLFVFHNYYLYIIVSILTSIATNIVTAIVANRMYPQYKAVGRLPKEDIRKINGRVRDLFTSKLGSVIVSSVDTIVISAYLGLTVLAEYQNYYYIFTSIAGLVEIIFTSLTAIIGNSIVMESKEKNYEDFNVLFFIIAWIAGFCSSCFLCLYQPFMELWVGRELMLDFGIVICFCVYFFVYEINRLLNSYKDSSGMWHSDRFRPLVVSLANLAMNLISVNYIGLYGIILSTVLSTACIGYPWLINNLFHEVFEPRHIGEVIKKLAKYALCSVAAAVASYFVCTLVGIPLLATMVYRVIVCIVVPNLLFFIFYHRSADFKNAFIFVNKKILKGKLDRLGAVVCK